MAERKSQENCLRKITSLFDLSLVLDLTLARQKAK